jgi:hypothetical protein
LEAITSGPLRDLSDNEFAWVVGRRLKNFPLEEDIRKELSEVGDRVIAGKLLSGAEESRITNILLQVRDRAIKKAEHTPDQRNGKT